MSQTNSTPLVEEVLDIFQVDQFDDHHSVDESQGSDEEILAQSHCVADGI